MLSSFSDPDYKKFVEALKNPEPAPTMTLEQCLEEIDKRDKERKGMRFVILPESLRAAFVFL